MLGFVIICYWGKKKEKSQYYSTFYTIHIKHYHNYYVSVYKQDYGANNTQPAIHYVSARYKINGDGH